jgi:hypothetical protein
MRWVHAAVEGRCDDGHLGDEGLSLREIGKLVGEMDYAAVAQQAPD